MAGARVEGLLGTVVEVVVDGPDGGDAVAAVIAEIERLELVFSVYRRDSELCRWRRGETAPGPELDSVVSMALEWCDRSGGAFNPFAGRLVSRWRRAETEGEPPPTGELADLVTAIAQPSALVASADLEGIDLNAIAKGYIVDRAASAAGGAAVRVMVNAGGDLVHVGEGEAHVGIEDPSSRYDNVAPLTVVAVSNAAVATSGRRRRGFSVGGAWLGHVIDPRTGRPTDSVASVTAVAGTAAEADALSTAVMVLGPDDGVTLAGRVAGAECLIVGTDRRVVTSPGWQGLSEG